MKRANRNIKNTRNAKNVRKLRNTKNNRRKLSIFRVSIALLLFIILLFGLYLLFSKQPSSQNDTTSQQAHEKTENQEPVSFTMTAIGDVMCHNTQYWDAYQKETDTYDFSYVFDDVKQYFEASDLTIGSIETTFAGKERGYSNYPTFNSPDALLYDLKELGVDVLSTAGNHALDTGFSGLSRTIDVLDEAGISHLGTYQSQEERDTILVKDVKGVKIAFINYTYGTNGIPIPESKPFSVNLIDKELIKKDIASAKAQNVDMIVACMHWGTEYMTSADSTQKELSDFLFQNGVDIILGNHPHVLQPMEQKEITLEDGTKKDVFVIYASGNFICDQNYENTRNSIILNLDITRNANGSISIDKVDYVPIHMYKNSGLSIRKMKLLDIRKRISDYDARSRSINWSYNISKFKKRIGENRVYCELI